MAKNTQGARAPMTQESAVQDIATHKAVQASPDTASNTGVILTSSIAKVDHKGLTIEFAHLSPASIAYLLRYGYNKSMQDACAGSKKKAVEARKAGEGEEFTAFCLTAGLTEEEGRAIAPEAFANLVVEAERTARHKAIVDGTIGTRAPSAPRVEGFDSVLRTVVDERLVETAKKQGKEVPKMAERQPFRDRLLNHPVIGKEIQAEAERRYGESLRIASAMADLDDLFDLSDESEGPQGESESPQGESEG